MKNILKFGINGNVLKTIALIAMVIDHIGFYFEPFLTSNLMIVCRCIGRIAMPIFTYLVVQGFFHTKNYKKYILRIGLWSVITQLCIIVLMIVNVNYFRNYVAAKVIYSKFNVLFTYIISLVILKIIHEDSLVKKWDYNRNISLKLICIILILILCIFIPMDYNIEVPILSILYYFIEKLKITFMIKTDKIRNRINKVIRLNEYMVIHGVYILLIFGSIWLVTVYMGNIIFTTFAIIPIALYNGERGNKSKILKIFFYFFFPMNHVLLYSLAMIITLT